MQDYLLVVFRDKRPVFVDDEQCGETNCIFQISTGTHNITLKSYGPIKDYHPSSQCVEVTGTAPNAPKVVLFT